MRLAFVYNGQGSEFAGMGQDWFLENSISQAIYNETKALVDYDLMFKGDMSIHQTKNAQPLLLVYNYALTKILAAAGISSTISCGLSLGEYNAFLESGVFSITQGLEIVSRRGELMQSALENVASGMIATLKVDLETIKAAIIEARQNDILDIANYNSYEQYVVAGSNEALARYEKIMQSQGHKRLVRLNVSGAFHSLFLTQASEEFAFYLAALELKSLQKPVILNYSGEVKTFLSAEEIKENFKLQLNHSVKFITMIENLSQLGVDAVIEIGPKSTLKRLINTINPKLKVYSVSTPKDVLTLKEDLL